jgi:hypothetical protein
MDCEGALENVSCFGETGEAVMDGMTAEVAHQVRCAECCKDTAMCWSSHVLLAVSSLKTW